MKQLFENWRKYLKEQEEPKVVTFDFDDTLSLSHWGEEEDSWIHDGPNTEFIEKLKKHKAAGDTVYVVTSRFEKYEARSLENPNQKAVQEFLDKNGIEVDGVYFTDGQPKIETLLQLGSVIHHDDDPEDILDARSNNIEAVVSDPYEDYNYREENVSWNRQQQEQDQEELEEAGMPPTPVAGTTSVNMKNKENKNLKDGPLT